MRAHDAITWHCHTKVEKYFSDADRWNPIVVPFEVVEIDGNLLLNAGINRVMSLIGGLGGAAFDATHSRLGVGTDSTASVATQADLNPSVSGSKYWRPVDATFPKLTGSTPNGLQFAATYGSTEANFAWNEWGVDNGTGTGNTVSAPLLNRKQESLGTKNTGSWVLTITISLS